jgi:hypothetical protein
MGLSSSKVKTKTQIGSCAPLITQHNVPGWRGMPYSRLLFQWSHTQWINTCDNKGSWAREHLLLATYNLYQLKTNKTHLKYYIKLMVFYIYIYIKDYYSANKLTHLFFLSCHECMMHKYKKQRLGVYPYWSSSVFTMII